MQRLVVDITVPAWRFAAVYRGEADAVIGRALDGRTVRLPALALRRHLTPEGIVGRFEVCFDQQNRLVSLRRVQRSLQPVASGALRG